MAAITADFCLELVDDRSVGAAGSELRGSVQQALAASRLDRMDQVFLRLSAALEKAATREATSVDFAVAGKALTFLSALPPRIPLPRIVVESENEVGLDWDEARRRVVSLTIDNSRLVGFSALIGGDVHYGRCELAEGIPETVDFLLSQLYPKRTPDRR